MVSRDNNIWVNRQGKRIPIVDMDTDHIRFTIEFLNRKPFGMNYEEILYNLKAELRKRNLESALRVIEYDELEDYGVEDLLR